MKTTLRKMGNSRGVLIPAPFLAACEITDEVELTIESGRLVVTPMRHVREGWFEGYDAKKDKATLPQGLDLASVTDWEW